MRDFQSHTQAQSGGVRNPYKGFTLVELLVVISIIALLIAILLPTLAKARESARTAICMSNVRQFTIATMMYIGDTKQVIPNAAAKWAHYGSRPQFYGSGLVAREYLSAPEAVMCPTMPGTSYYTGAANDAVNPWDRKASTSTAWGVHWRATTSTTTAPMGTYNYFGGLNEDMKTSNQNYWNQQKNRELRTVDVLQPSLYAIAADYDGTRTSSTFTPPIAVRIGLNPHPLVQGKSFAWFDGHVTFIPPAYAPYDYPDFERHTPMLTAEGIWWQYWPLGDAARERIADNTASNPTVGPKLRRIIRVPN